MQDMRTYVALSNETVAAAHMGTSESQEIWGYWPDDEPLKGLHPGDTRAALTPFLAHEVWASACEHRVCEHRVCGRRVCDALH